MFSGIIQAVGRVIDILITEGNHRVRITTDESFVGNLRLGASVSVAGACLTIVEYRENWFSVDISDETMRCTTFKSLATGNLVNLESALTLADSLDGHLVSGHIDGVGTIQSMVARGESTQLRVKAAGDIMRYVVRKGSVCLDGVSLTVNHVDDETFDTNLIPHTCKVTTFATRKVGDTVNIEVDLIARYIERLTQGRGL